jgi:hypothetical protein
MLNLRTLAIVITGAGVFAGLTLTDAQACDDDRYPCPIRSQPSTQETADAPAQPAPSTQPQKRSAQPQKKSVQPQKKANQAAGPNEKAHAKREREEPRATARAKGSKPAVHHQAADSILQKTAETAPAVAPLSPADPSLNGESPNERLVATAGTVWPVLANTESAGASVAEATGLDATEAGKADAVQLVDPNEVNDLDRAAAASVVAESSWITYLLLILGAALALASAVWFFSRMTSVLARRAATPRMHTISS